MVLWLELVRELRSSWFQTLASEPDVNLELSLPEKELTAADLTSALVLAELVAVAAAADAVEAAPSSFADCSLGWDDGRDSVDEFEQSDSGAST